MTRLNGMMIRFKGVSIQVKYSEKMIVYYSDNKVLKFLMLVYPIMVLLFPILAFRLYLSFFWLLLLLFTTCLYLT